ncbi:restriction endonuclease subunit S [Bremerella sp.]|uniref:restriction endonuclease subunit S n=1 Tax=Bremerella sp. TaxID=2795602 RepID=UPI003918D86A
MKTELLGKIAKINPRVPVELSSDASRTVHFVPMSELSEKGFILPNGTRRLGEVIKGYTYFENGDVLVAKITPCMENGKAALVEGLEHDVAFGSTEFHVLRPNQEVDGKYLFYMIWNPVFRHQAEIKMTGSAGQKRVPKTFLERFEIPLPKLEEQKRIAAILDKTNTICRKRQETIAELEALEDSVFAFTVGTRARGYADWKEVTIESLAASHKGAMRTGPFGSSLLHSEFVDEGIAVLGIDNAVQNRFAWDQRRFITPEKYEEMKRYTVYPNDVIITIMGTVGRSAVIPKDIPTAITTKHIATLTIDTKIAEPEFVSQAMHRHPVIAMQMTNRGAIMNSWNLGLIKSLKVPLPPIEVQREFTKRVRQLHELRNNLESGVSEAYNLFNSLVQRAFKGEL